MSGILLAHRHAGAKTGIVLPNIGDPFYGGYYAGIIDTISATMDANDQYPTGKRYAVIAAPASLRTTGVAWCTSAATVTAAQTRWEGLAATMAMNSSAFPAAKFCVGLSYPSDGASAWYLPAMDEAELLYRNLKPTSDPNDTSGDVTPTFPSNVRSGYNPSSDPRNTAYTASAPPMTSLAIFQSGGAQCLAPGAVTLAWTATNASSTQAISLALASTYSGRPRPSGQTNTATSRAVIPVRRLVLA